LVDNSPRTIAASHVLHRLLMPRHPPCALTHLHTTRCSHPLCNTQHTTTPQPHNHHHTHPVNFTGDALGDQARSGHQEHNPTGRLLRTQQCAEHASQNWSSCSTQPHPPPTHQRVRTAVQAWNPVKGDPQTFRACRHPTQTVRLLRKEVIQPHLPVRLPCYDFVPIASPTFDNSLPQAG
jgi:hypothetical protein